MKKSYLLIIILGTVLVFSNSSHAADFSQSVTLSPGWNIVSTPRVLESHSFSVPETSDNFDIYVLSTEAVSKWATMADLGQSEFVPLFGYFINNKTGVSQTLQLNYKLDPNPSERLFNMTFSQPGWYSIGIANPTYSVPWCPGINFADSNNVSNILNPIAGNHSTVIDFTDGNTSATSVAVSDQWKAVTPDNLNNLRDLTDLKGYAVYITKADALYSGFQNTNGFDNYCPPPATLTLGLAATPDSRTLVKGTANVDIVGITFTAAQASALRVTDITITGYAGDTTSYNEGVATSPDTAVTIANAVTNIRLVEAETGNTIAGIDKMSDNSLSVADTGSMKFSFASAPWIIPAGSTKTMLVRVDLTNNAVSGAYDYYAFDVVATTDVTALDSSNNTVNASNTAPNGGVSSPIQVLTVSNSGTLTIAQSPDSPVKAAAYWGQTAAPFSKFRFTSTNEGQYIEKLTIAVLDSTEATNAKANVKTVRLTYRNKAGNTVTSTQSFTSGASANFGFTGDSRPYVPKDSNLDIAVSADLKTKAEGATNNVNFSLDLSDTYNGSAANGFKSVGEGSGTVLYGTAIGVDDVTTTQNKYVYRVFPKVDVVALASPYLLIGAPDVFKFTVTAMGTPDSKLLFDGLAVGSGSIKFEVVASGEYNPDGTKTSFEVFDESNIMIDAGEITADALPSPHASLTFDFGSQDIEIPGGNSKTFRIQLTNPSTNYSKTTTTDRAADYFQLVLRDEAGLINWVGNSSGSTADEDTTSVAGVLRNLPATGPTFQR